MIFSVNNLLVNLNRSLGESFIGQVEGELRVLRALGYYDFPSFYRDVFLVTDPNFDQDSAPELTVASEIEEFIIEEMEGAIDLLSTDAPDSRPGAITKGAAMMLKLKTHLRRKEWQMVIDLAEEMNALGKYFLEPDFMTLWELGKPFNNEVIFNVMTTGEPFGRGLGELSSGSCTMPVYMYDLQTDWNGFGGGFHLERDFFFSYDSADVRWNRGCRQFWLSSATATLGDTVKSPGPDGLNVIRRIEGSEIIRYPGPGPGGNSRFYFSNKYPHPDADTEGVLIYHNSNLPVFRWADVLLAWAEAINELEGPSSEVYDKINLVRGRAGLTSIESELATIDQSSIRDAILQERAWEFAMEAKRREDLIRHGKFIEVVTQSYGYTSKTSAIITEDQIYYPFPFTEIALNPQWGD